jgi:hypothetical protein
MSGEQPGEPAGEQLASTADALISRVRGLMSGLTVDEALRRIALRLKGVTSPIVRAETQEVLEAKGEDRAVMAKVVECDDHTPLREDAWSRLAATKYAGFARRVLDLAVERVAAIHAGESPYAADKAFTRDEVEVLGRAMRVALLRDEPWVPELLDRLLPRVAVAPTAAKTLPSQALLYELARATEDFPTPEAVAALRNARSIVRHKAVPKQLDRMLKRIERALAERPEVAFRLPDLGFGPDGVRRVPVGGHVAVLTVADKVELTWQKADGSALRGVPAAVRRDHADEVKELRGVAKQAQAHLVTLTRGLEAGYATETTHRFGRWRDELAGHPLGGTLVRRLIWEIEAEPGQWRAVLPDGGELRDVTGAAVPAPGPDAGIRLWHPIRADAEEIRAWRDLLTERRVRQPFKQAFREIYRLTPAELETRIYSNRFAAHIVHYRKLYAMIKGRGWATDLLGPWDGGDQGRAVRTFAGGAWRAVFFHDYLEYGAEMELASTDQVRFERMRHVIWGEAPLADVPPMVFSEAMRDVDLFVGVTSIAADPDWADHGEDRFVRYWRTVGFGELTPSAETRRDVLQRIIPKTKIADRCAIDDRYLVVRGNLRTYRIHLGSANILMDPDASYLCIVPSRRPGTDQVFLPFEDERLALILSKAFLLADDTAITDESILQQIKRGA